MRFWPRSRPESIETRDRLVSPSDWLNAIFGAAPVAAGVSVNATTAMRCTAVRCAVQAIAEPLGQFPVHVYERGADGSRERVRDHSVAALLNGEANDWTPASDFREQIVRDALLHGNGYAFINRTDGETRELLRLAPETISVEADATTGEPIYRLQSSNQANRFIPREDILHLRAPSLNGISGASPVEQAKEAIACALVMEEHASRLFGNGARPSGVIEFPGNLGEDGVKRMKLGWEATHATSHRSGKTAILWDGAKFNPLTFSSVDAQFLELRRFAIEEIARAFRVPPVFLMDYGRATWGNSEEMGRQFVTYTLMRWIKALQGEIRLKLFTREERQQFFPEVLVDDLLRADISARAEAYSKLIAARVLNPNEARAMENRPPYEGGNAFINPNTTTNGTPEGQP